MSITPTTINVSQQSPKLLLQFKLILKLLDTPSKRG